ncbi:MULTISPECIES: hypothetical protein [Gordonia]|uniref:hypothetical protein n=1 Tax=Gordonia TaxID=2053 RepID=UPI0030191F89
MNPIIIDTDSGDELWVAGACADHAGVNLREWNAHVSRGRAPAPVARIGHLQLWVAHEVHSWTLERRLTGTNPLRVIRLADDRVGQV